MEQVINPPFKVGDLAEAMTFEEGFRGAWFRCKIVDLFTREGKIGHVSEYFDFPDEKLEWAQLYQMPPWHEGRTEEGKIELMLRPPYPPIYRKSQMPLVSEISEVTVIVDDTWKVGDLVDWWTTDCYWSGRITRLLGNFKALIELKQPPLGEGETYNVLLKDLRPSLDWSLECGWTVPRQGGKKGRVCAWIIEPLNQGHETMSGHKKDEPEDKRTSDTQRQVSDRRTSEQSHGPDKNHGAGGGVALNSMETDASGEIKTQGSEDKRTSEQYIGPNKNLGAGRRVALNSMETDTLEEAVMDLEELVNKVKWIRKILEHGVSFSDSERPDWEFADQSPASSAPK